MIDERVEKYMLPINAAIVRHLGYGSEFTDIYNNAYEAISFAIEDQEAKIKILERQLAAANEDAERLAKGSIYESTDYTFCGHCDAEWGGPESRSKTEYHEPECPITLHRSRIEDDKNAK
jgi:hypothetical protein